MAFGDQANVPHKTSRKNLLAPAARAAVMGVLGHARGSRLGRASPASSRHHPSDLAELRGSRYGTQLPDPGSTAPVTQREQKLSSTKLPLR